MDFELGVDACVVVRTGWCSFDVFPASGGGRHVLELLAIPDSRGIEYFNAYLDGVEINTDGCVGVWDLLTELVVGQAWTYNSED